MPLDYLARECADLLRYELGDCGVKFGPVVLGESKIGLMTPHGWTIQRHIDLLKPADHADVVSRMTALAAAIAQTGRSLSFYELWLPESGEGGIESARATFGDISVRLLKWHHASTGDSIIRVDALFVPHNLGATA